MLKSEILNCDPINGTIIIQVDLGQIKEDLGLSRDSKLVLTDMQEKRFAGATSRGKIIKLSEDAFGAKYQERYGVQIKPPEIGDHVFFTPYQIDKLDAEGEFYKVKDDSIDLVLRGAK